MEELQERVAELEQELEETQENLDTASSIGQQMVTRLQEIEEENEELRDGTMAPDAIHESEIVRPHRQLDFHGHSLSPIFRPSSTHILHWLTF